jgi:outer membrane lipoprotein-sorting protein
MKTSKVLAVATAVLLSVSAYAQTIDEIVDKHVAALGGLDKISAVNTMVIERSLAVNGMEIPNKTILVVGKSLRNESVAMGHTMVQVVDGGKGWMIRPTVMGGTGEPEDLPAEMLRQQMSSLDPFGGLVNYKEKGNTVELIGKEKVDKKDVYHIKLTTKDGQAVDEYLDANSFLISKIKMSANGQESQIDLSDYKQVEGVKIPFTMDIASSQMSLSFVTSKVAVNTKIDEAIFKKPVK